MSARAAPGSKRLVALATAASRIGFGVEERAADVHDDEDDFFVGGPAGEVVDQQAQQAQQAGLARARVAEEGQVSIDAEQVHEGGAEFGFVDPRSCLAFVPGPRLGLAATGGTLLAIGLVLLAVSVVLGLNAVKPDDITAVRLRQAADTLEATAIILLIPLVLLVFDFGHPML